MRNRNGLLCVMAVGPLLVVTQAGLAQPCTPAWSGSFPGGDFDGPVRTFVYFDDGVAPGVYAGGTFTRAGGVHAQGVAKWTGSGWVQVGGDFDGDVSALAVYDDGSGAGPKLWAGGHFTRIGGTLTHAVARWSGTSWIGTTIDGNVRALAGVQFSNGTRTLFAGGDFLRNGSLINEGVLPVTGNSSAQPLPTSGELDMQVYALAAYSDASGPALYATGVARAYNGVGIARFQSSWSRVGTSSTPGLDGPGYALATYTIGANTDLYVGGDFQHAGGVAASRVARWNGSAWSAVGAGVDGPVRTMLAADADGPFGPLPASLYVGGEFAHAGAVSAPNIAAWNGGSWVGAGSGVNGPVLGLGALGGIQNPALLVGGNFAAAGGVAAAHAAAFTGYGWQALASAAPGNSPTDVVYSLAWFDDDGPGPDPAKLYIGGSFRTVGAMQADYIASWDGSAWAPVAGGVNGRIGALKVHDDGTGPALYAAGAFTVAGGQPAHHAARYRNGRWEAVGGGIDGLVYAMESYTPPGSTPRLVVSGSVAPAGGTSGSAAAQWDGTSWRATGAPLNSFSNGGLAVFDDGAGPRLYLGVGSSTTPVLRWDGTSWGSASTGLPILASVFALHVFDDGTGPALFAGGLSLGSGSLPPAVARFRNGAWTPLTGGPNSFVNALADFDDGTGRALYAGGNDSAYPGNAGAHLSKWNGSWSGVALAQPSGSALILAMASFDPDGTGTAPEVLAMGGSFQTMAGVSSPNLAELIACPTCYANCDRSTVAPVLNVNDFLCFMGRFAAGNPGANCDGSTELPVLNMNDFMCFMGRFAAGCP